MRITGDNLDETIECNGIIREQVLKHISFIEKRIIKWQSLPIEEQALEILREHDLIEVPIPDENWGGAIRKFPNGKRIPIINTAQPRLYQYFIYWHEIYHLTEDEEMEIHNQNNYEISIDFDLNERKADFFASQMIFKNSDLYSYYNSLKKDDFMFRISHCMKSYKAPYKAVLIQLYQIASGYNDNHLRETIREHFDRKYSIGEWSSIFQQYALDDNLVKPSFITNLNTILDTIKDQIKIHPGVEMFEDNLNVVAKWEAKYKSTSKQTEGM